MKTITLEEAHQILEDASAVIIDDSIVLYPSLSNLNGDDLNEFLYFNWDDEGLGYSLKFCEGDNRKVMVVGSSLFLYETDGDGEEQIQITILTTKELE